MTKIYFVKTDDYNCLIATDEVTALMFDGTPTGKVEGIDLYAPDAVEQFKEFYKANTINDYTDMYSKYTFSYGEISDMLEDAELVYSEIEYVVEFTDNRTGATSPIDTFKAPAGYTAKQYIADCERNADEDWCEMLRQGEVNLVECD